LLIIPIYTKVLFKWVLRRGDKVDIFNGKIIA